MKANNNFREQVGQVTSWFKEWSECEQTVALYSLLKKLSPAQAKFLDQVLQQSLADCIDVMQLQKKANDDVFIAGLCAEDKGQVMLQLLQMLPLLQAGNEKAKAEYLKLIPEVLSHTIENGVNIEESRQLLSYSLIHPAITHQERANFSKWLGYLEERFTITQIRPSGTSIMDSLTYTSMPMAASQEGINNSLGMAAAASPNMGAGNGWHGHGHIAHYGMDGGAGSSSGLGDGGAGGANLLSNGHMGLRATNSHAGAFTVNVHNGHMPLHATSSAPPNFETFTIPTSQGSSNQSNLHTPLQRTRSIIHGNPLPLRIQNPEKTVSDWLQMHPAVGNGCGVRGRSPSLTEHAPLSPQSSVTSSGSGGSDSHHDDGPQPIRDSFLEEGSGMRDVPVWLKTLRLHKYSYLFRQMTYDEMLNISEEWLEAQKVTKGARHKIVLSILKLQERQQLLRDFEKNIMEGGAMKEVLGEMKSMLNTPIKAYSPTLPISGVNSLNTSHLASLQSPCSPDTEEGNLPGQFCRLMGKVCTQLLTASVLDDDCIQHYFQLIDKCLNHEAFSQRQKSLLSSWKQQAQQIWQPPPHKYDRRQRSWGNTFPMGNTVAARGNTSRSRLMPGQTGVQQWSFGSRRSVLGAAAHAPLQRNSSLNTAILNKPGLLETKQTVTRTQSAPLRSSQLSLSMQNAGPEQVTDVEINARLDSLCLSMTEHAIGSLDGCDKTSTF